MTPIESAVKNRIKDAYAFKVDNMHWESIINYIRNQNEYANSLKQYHVGLEKKDNDEMMHYVPLYQKQPQYSIGETGDNPDISCLSESVTINEGIEELIETNILIPGDPTKNKYDKNYVFKIVDITEKL